MPYVHVWVDEIPGENCAICEAREEDDITLIKEIQREWIWAKDHGDYGRFEEFIAGNDRKGWRMVVYGPDMPARR